MIEHPEARLALVDLVVPGLGDPERTAAVRTHVAGCAECRAELEGLRQVHERVRAAGPPARPSAALEQRVLALAAAVPAAAAASTPAPEPRRGVRRADRAGVLWRNVWTWRAATAVLALALIALIPIAAGGDDGEGWREQAAASLQSGPGASIEGSAALLASPTGARAVRVTLDRVPPTPPGVYYELWLARSLDRRISLGTVRPDREGRLAVTVALPALDGGWRGVWVTRERADGDPRWTEDWIAWARLG